MFSSIEDVDDFIFSQFRFGSEICRGTYTAIFEPGSDWVGSHELLLVTVDENKFKFQKHLFGFYGITLTSPIEVYPGLWVYSVPRLEVIEYMFPRYVIDGFHHLNQYYNDESFMSNEEQDNSLSCIFDSFLIDHSLPRAPEFSKAISIAELALKVISIDIRLDFTEEQFCYLNGEIICIDPVLFD